MSKKDIKKHPYIANHENKTTEEKTVIDETASLKKFWDKVHRLDELLQEHEAKHNALKQEQEKFAERVRATERESFANKDQIQRLQESIDEQSSFGSTLKPVASSLAVIVIAIMVMKLFGFHLFQSACTLKQDPTASIFKA